MTWGFSGEQWAIGIVVTLVIGLVMYVITWETGAMGRHNREQREFMKSPEFWGKMLGVKKAKPPPSRQSYIEKMQKAVFFKDCVSVERVYMSWQWDYRNHAKELEIAEAWRQRAIAAIFRTKGGAAADEDVF